MKIYVEITPELIDALVCASVAALQEADAVEWKSPPISYNDEFEKIIRPFLRSTLLRIAKSTSDEN